MGRIDKKEREEEREEREEKKEEGRELQISSGAKKLFPIS
jgi:hypothetical protein